jgi:hypothetical protein
MNDELKRLRAVKEQLAQEKKDRLEMEQLKKDIHTLENENKPLTKAFNAITKALKK